MHRVNIDYYITTCNILRAKTKTLKKQFYDKTYYLTLCSKYSKIGYFKINFVFCFKNIPNGNSYWLNLNKLFKINIFQ